MAVTTTTTVIGLPPEEKLTMVATTWEHQTGVKSPSEEDLNLDDTSMADGEEDLNLDNTSMTAGSDSDSYSDSDSDSGWALASLSDWSEDESMTTTGSDSSDSDSLTDVDGRGRPEVVERTKCRYRRMTPEEWTEYHRRVAESDGFDVGTLDGIGEAGIIVPVDPMSDKDYKILETYTLFGINNQPEENQKRHNVELIRILKANRQSCSPMNYYITFEAKDMDDGGAIKTYQTQVNSRIPKSDTFVMIFREEPHPK